MSDQEWQPRQHDPLCPAFDSCGYCDAPADYTEPRKMGTSMGPMILDMRPQCQFGSCECTCSDIVEIRTDQIHRMIEQIRAFDWSPETDDADIERLISGLQGQ